MIATTAIERTGSFLRNDLADAPARGCNPDIVPAPAAALKAEFVDPLRGDEWDRDVLRHPAATPFHSSAWARVLSETYGHTPLYLRVKRGDTTAALLPVMEVKSRFTGARAVSLPFSDLCPPLVFDSSSNESLVQELIGLGQERQWKHFELREAQWLHEVAPAAATFFGHKLDLTVGVAELERRCASNVRRNLRKAARSDLKIEITHEKSAVAEFYRLLERTRRRHGVPPQSRRFFLKIHEHMIAAGLGFVVLARRETEAVAGAVFFHFGDNALYKYGASDERQQEFRANNLVMWEAIRHLAQSGLRSLHFGRTARENEGLRRFKLAWGAEEEIISYFRFTCAKGRWSTAERDLAGRAGGIFKRLPLAVNRLIGTMVYPHLD